MSHLTLEGCAPEPLASYLKSLAVLRLIAEQKDANAKGWWEGDIFHLDSSLDEDGLVRFFLSEYKPSPLVAPWGGRSGFYPGSSEASARKRLEDIAKSTSDRLALFRDAIVKVQALLSRHGFSEKPKDEQAKLKLMQLCRSELPDNILPWLDAVYALSNEWRGFAPLFGTGANEGSQSYSSTFAGMLMALGIHKPSLDPEAVGLLHQALFGSPASGLIVAPAGQHDPGRAGGFNQGMGIEQKDFPINPWALVLAFEGGLLWSCGFSRSLVAAFSGRTKSSGRGAAVFCSPFTVNPKAVGYSSSGMSDVSDARAEIWAPLWSRPLGCRELRAFLSEGRADIGRLPAMDGIEFAAAATSLGVDRGVSEFMRFSLLKRRGDSYVALPIGKFPVGERRESDLLRELDPILRRLDRFRRSFKAMGQEAPARFLSARRRIDEALYDLLRHGGAVRVKALIAAIGQMEKLIAERDHTKDPKLNPLSGLSPKWLLFADDGSVEVRIAATLASIRATDEVGPIRANLAPVDPAKPWRWGDGLEQTAWIGNSLPARMVAVLNRRMLDAQRLVCRHNPLYGDLAIRAEDIASFIEGELDEKLVEDLLFGFTWVKWNDLGKMRDVQVELMRRWSSPAAVRVVPRSWALLKLLFLPSPIRISDGEGLKVRPEPSVVPLLCANRIDDACKVAQRRLFSAGLTPVQSRFQDGTDGIRIAAALLIPVLGVQSLMRLISVPTSRGESV